MAVAQSVLMIRPANFCFNAETAESNTFQSSVSGDIKALAVAEFDGAVAKLRAAGVAVNVIEDTPEPVKPDAVFPNNWISFHPGGKAIIYPLLTENRKAEVRLDIPEKLGFKVAMDLRNESGDKAMEGTGSLVFDHDAKIGYCCLSPRCDEALAQRVCDYLGYRLVVFKAHLHGAEIYHTNVVMAVGEKLIVICLEVCSETEALVAALDSSGKEILTITTAQLESFAGNMLQLRSSDGGLVWAMSATAWNSLDSGQRSRLEASGKPVIFDILTIEKVGGGSARCMLAELA